MTPLHVLAILDSPLRGDALIRILDRAGFDVVVNGVASEEEFRRGLDIKPDIILCDGHVRHLSGSTALAIVRLEGLAIPVIVIGGVCDAVVAMKEGAADCLPLDQLDSLGSAVRKALVGARRDSERRSVEEAHRVSDERLRLFTEHSGEIFWIADRSDGHFEFVSSAYERIFGMKQSPGSMAESAWLASVHPDDRARVRQAAQARRGGASTDELYRIVRPGGEIRWLHERARLERQALVEPTRILGMATDVTETRRPSHQLRHAYSLETTGRLARSVADDVSELLRGIRRRCDDLLASSGAAVVAQTHMSAIKDAAGRAIALTSRLALFDHRDTLKRSALDANAVVVGLAPILGRLIGTDVAVRIELAPEPLFVRADAATIEQVLLDLAVNSRDVMPGGGELLIETAAVERAGSPTGGPSTPFVRLAVTDTGADVPPGVRADIFEPFFINEPTPGAAQLGLANLDTVVHRHEGWLELETATEGTTFAVYLPRLVVDPCSDPCSDEDIT